MRLEKLLNILKIDSSDEDVLLESYCFLLNYHQEQINNKKDVGTGNIFKKNRTRNLP